MAGELLHVSETAPDLGDAARRTSPARVGGGKSPPPTLWPTATPALFTAVSIDLLYLPLKILSCILYQ